MNSNFSASDCRAVTNNAAYTVTGIAGQEKRGVHISCAELSQGMESLRIPGKISKKAVWLKQHNRNS